MAELNLDSAEDVIALDKQILSFNLEPASATDTNGGYGKSECTVAVKNLTSGYVAVRTKTTKKDVYAVNPTYGVVNPNGTLEIKFVYYIKDLNEDPRKHKFKFEGIVAERSLSDKEARSLFDTVSSNKIRVKGNAIKREVVFNFVKSKPNIFKKEETPGLNLNNQSMTTSNILSGPEHSPESTFKQDVYIAPSKANVVNQNAKNENDKQADAQLQDLKMELHKYKNQLNNLTETHKNLKNRVEMEKSRDIQSTVNFSVSASEEKQISKKYTIILFVVSIILGFILSR